jgi:adenine-specific DNA-methyltransferase
VNFIANESAQKLRGGFYTPPDIAGVLARWVLAKNPRLILEPSCGDGNLLAAVASTQSGTKREILACEIDTKEAAKAASRVPKGGRTTLNLHVGDFLHWFLFRDQGACKFDAVVGNPPFIRYQYLDVSQQFLAEKIFHRFGLPFTKHTNAWVPFVIASLSLLAPGGRLAMVVPSEIFHIPHAQSLRHYLARDCSRILVFDPEELWFEEALQGVVLLLAEKKTSPDDYGHGLTVQTVRERHILREDPEHCFATGNYLNGETIHGKWMPIFLTANERALMRAARENAAVAPFSEIAKVDVGIVTGANKFFLVPDSTVEAYGLEKWAHPMFGRSEHVAGIIYDRRDHQENRRAGLPANFLWFDAENAGAYPLSVQEYFRSGEIEGLPERYKCRVRTPWFKVPSVYATPVGMLKRAHHFPRLVWNRASAFTTDTAYRIQPIGISPESLVLSFLNSLTCVTAELEGRHYGGGVLELVPSEIERLLLPRVTATIREVETLDETFRSASNAADVLRIQDDIVLKRIGFTPADCSTLHSAWLRLRRRRQRTPEPSALA